MQKPRFIKRGSLNWSAREDSNLRPTGPKPVALPSCATRRNVLLYIFTLFFSWCERGDLNPHAHRALTPEASASTNSATLAMSQKKMGWLMGLEPTTTGITIQGSTN